ncbi:glycosyltransferase [Collimonas sp. H4R21]|uniref:Glycosyltransferase n=1 Tax=Collimonas rhizosphaerae TaxID=3126357 RepID=A0ABU9PZQ8_9BURK
MTTELDGLEFTGERFVPEEQGNIVLEHLHRYLQACEIAGGKVVLDIASGEGYGSAMLANKALQVIGVDISEEAVEHAKNRYQKKNLEYRVGSCASIPLPDASVDMIVSFETIEHHDQHEEMMQEFKRVLRPNGVVLISSPDKYHYSIEPGYSNPYHVKELLEQEFKQLLGNYFKNTSYFGQRIVYGSGIFSESMATRSSSYSYQGKIVGQVPGMSKPVYWVAIASDGELPVLASGMLEQPINDSELIREWSRVVAERDGQIREWSRVATERNRQLVNMQQIVNQLERRVSTLSTETVKRGEWAVDLDLQLQQAQAELSSLTSSHSWKITMPLRESRRWLTHPVAQAKRYVKFAARTGRALYLRLPLSEETRAGHRSALEKYAPRLLRASLGQIVPPAPLQARAVVGTPYSEFDLSKNKIELATSLTPLVSVIVPIYGKSNYTLRCLASIAAHSPALAFEIIVVDDCSPDDSANILRGIKGIRLISNQENQGFIRSCNLGAKAANGQYLCFLNNDTEVTSGWLDELLRTFREFPGTGLVGSKLVYPDGSLQEAGGIIWQDGSAWNFGRNQDQLQPMYNYAREVDYCSGASIMLTKSLFEELGGFDEHYLPAYCEDSDLALKIRDRGYRVIYQPLSVVVHYEGITSGTDTGQGAKAYQVANLQKQFQRWQKRLASHQANGVDVDDAKDRMAKRRVLVLDHCTPTPDQDAGSVITFNLLLLLREMDFQVTFIPENNFLYLPDYTSALQRAGIEVLYAPYCNSVKQHVIEVGERYDLVFMFRPMVVVNHLDVVRRWCPQAKVLFHTVDLHYLRMSREADMLGDAVKQEESEQMKKVEFDGIRGADASIVVSVTEQEILRRELPDQKIHVFPLIMDIRGTDKTFNDRCDIVFVGGYQHVPNIDAVIYFVTEIMPILRQKLPGVRFYAVGSNVPEQIEALASEDVIITGFVEDLSPLLDRMRVSVAPLRFGAGIKGKIGTSMAAGLPAVATTLAAEGMSLTPGQNILVADGAQAFADAVVQLYQDEPLWTQLSEAGIAFAESAWGAEAAWKTLGNILHDLDLDVERNTRPLALWCNKLDVKPAAQGTL